MAKDLTLSFFSELNSRFGLLLNAKLTSEHICVKTGTLKCSLLIFTTFFFSLS